MNEAIHVVYDCMIFLQAVARPGRSHGTMRLVREKRVTLFISAEALAEVRDVLTRSEIRQKFPALTPDAVDIFLNDLLASARLVKDVPAVFSLPRDKKDEPYINLAIAAGARYLVTWNERHLTYLMRQDTPEGRDFCQRFPNV
jgi:putative PIN family toxin of toxin-antitoxin system